MFWESELMVRQEQLKDLRRQRKMERMLASARKRKRKERWQIPLRRKANRLQALLHNLRLRRLASGRQAVD